MFIDIFNLAKHNISENTPLFKGLITKCNSTLPFGHPCIIVDDGTKEATVLLLNGLNVGSVEYHRILKSSIRPISNYDITKHEVVNIENVDFFSSTKTEFQKSMFMDLITNGVGKSLIFRESVFHQTMPTLIDYILSVRNWFNYYCLIRNYCDEFYIDRSLDSSKITNLDLALIVSFFPLTDSIPVFNLKEVAGLSVSITLSVLIEIEGHINRINILDLGLALNNYKHAVYEIDGEELEFKKKLSSDDVLNLKRNVYDAYGAFDFFIKNSHKDSEKKPIKKEKAATIEKNDTTITYMNSSVYSGFNSTTSSSNYYYNGGN